LSVVVIAAAAAPAAKLVRYVVDRSRRSASSGFNLGIGRRSQWVCPNCDPRQLTRGRPLSRTAAV